MEGRGDRDTSTSAVCVGVMMMWMNCDVMEDDYEDVLVVSAVVMPLMMLRKLMSHLVE